MLFSNLVKKSLLSVAAITSLAACEEVATVSILSETEDFVQAASEVNNKIDILWIVDNSGSMGDEQAALASNFEAFINDLAGKNYDFQIAVIGTDAYMEGRRAYRNASGHSILTPNTPDLENAFIQNIMLGTSGYPIERGLESLEAALNHPANQSLNFPRNDAFFSVIIVSDENESVSSFPGVTHYQGLLDSIRSGSVLAGQQTYSINAIVRRPDDVSCGSGVNGVTYLEVADATGGIQASICDDFATSLTDITSSIVQLSTQFYLSREPIVETIRVVVNDVEVPNDSSNGWTYNAESNSIIFNGSAVPGQGASILVDFDPVALIN
jgi:hypothetical protein